MLATSVGAKYPDLAQQASCTSGSAALRVTKMKSFSVGFPGWLITGSELGESKA